MRSGPTIISAIFAIAGLSACASGRTVPDVIAFGFEPGIVRTEAATCSQHGGVVDSQDAGAASERSVISCRIGTPMAAYRCEGGRYLVRLHQDASGAHILQRSADDYEPVTSEIAMTGTRWSGEHVTVVETNHGVIVTTAEQRTVCDSEEIDAVSRAASAR